MEVRAVVRVYKLRSLGSLVLLGSVEASKSGHASAGNSNTFDVGWWSVTTTTQRVICALYLFSFPIFPEA